MEEQPHASTVGAANTLEEGTLAALQEVPNSHQGMKRFPQSIVAATSFDDGGDLLLHEQGSNHTAIIEKIGCTGLCNMKTFKEETNHHSHEPLLDCTSHLRFGFEDLKGDSRHLGVRNPFSFQDDAFSTSSSQLKEELLLS